MHTNRLRAFDNGQQRIEHKTYDIQFDVHNTVIHTSRETRLEIALTGETPPPADMYFTKTRNMVVTITTAGTAKRYQVSRSSSDLRPSNESLDLLADVVEYLQDFLKEYEYERTGNS